MSGEDVRNEPHKRRATALVSVGPGEGGHKPLIVYVCDDHRAELLRAGFPDASRTSTSTLVCGMCVERWLRESRRAQEGAR